MSKNKSIRVLHVVYAMNTGGVESWLMSIYRHLNREKIQFDFLVNTQKEAFFDDEIKQFGGNIIYAGALSNPLKIYRTAKRVMNKTKYHAVHCHNVENATPVLKAAIACNIDIRIYQSHNDLNTKLKHLSYFKSMYLKISRILALKYANRFLAVSKSAGDSLFGGHKYQILSLGIEVERFNPSNDVLISRGDFSLKDDDFVIGHVGRFDIQKNHAFLIDVAKELIDVNPKTKILLIGKGVLEEELKDQINKEKLGSHFIFTGLRSDVPEIMSSVMDTFLFPSLSEGLGLVLVEAQAAGLPIVCTDVIPDEATVNTDLIRKMSLSKSAKEWAEVLVTHYQQNKHYEKEKAYKEVKDSPFNLSKTTNKLIQVWTNNES